MTLKEQIDGDIKKAMLSKNKDELRALRAIKSMILLAETEKGAGDGLDTAREMAILQKAVKQRKDSIALYREQGREDLADSEATELNIIERYLPAQMTAEELTDALKSIIAEVGASSPRDMGKVMGIASKRLAGKADNKLIAEHVRQLLS